MAKTNHTAPNLAVVILVLLQLCGCIAARHGQEGEPSGASPNRSAKQSLLAGFQYFNGTADRTPAVVLGDLGESRDGASSEELKAIDALRPILGGLVNHQPLSPTDEGLLGKLLQQFGKEHPEDFEVQLAVAKGLDRVERDLQTRISGSATGDSESFTPAATVLRGLTLVGAFPNQSRAHEYLALMLASAGGDQLSGMRSFVRCLQLDPGSIPCRTGFKLLAADYIQPKCLEYGRSKFSIQRAYRQAKRLAAGATSVTVLGQKFYPDPRLSLTGSDIQEISPALAQSDHTWLVTLTPSGAQRYFSLTSELAAKQDYALIRIDGKPVAALRVMSPVDSGQLGIPQAGINPAKICQKTQRRSLPPDLTDAVY